MPPSEVMAGLAKGLAVLEAFGAAGRSLTIAEAARMTDLNRAVARRCLLTLVDLGYLSHDGKNFSPTPRVLRLGDAYVETAALPQLAKPHLTAVRDQIGESVSLAVLQGDASLFVARSEVSRIVNTGVRVGAALPLYASATGYVLLAGLDDALVEEYLDRTELKARTPRTPVTRAEVRRRVRSVRDEGVAFTDGELESGLRSVAVPVRDSLGAVQAAMSISASGARVPLEEMREVFLPVLRQHAEQTGRLL